MTLYLNSIPRLMRHRMMEEMMTTDRPRALHEVNFPVDIKTNDDSYQITALLPGLKPEDVTIQITSEMISLQGEFNSGREDEDTYLLSERPAGKFYREFTLPDQLDAGKAQADMQDGVLTINVPKAETAKPKTIKVVAK
ncbi:MAG: Hsp20/alpha crystallin family protein [Anaerolineaceae bacterium]